ncbi:hypothetical protein [Photorhabdus australis]|uniref:hypothetical protein n=1 Tax=Photorhabdus australis TaxID=286156 RepID=UPI0030DAC08D
MVSSWCQVGVAKSTTTPVVTGGHGWQVGKAPKSLFRQHKKTKSYRTALRNTPSSRTKGQHCAKSTRDRINDLTPTLRYLPRQPDRPPLQRPDTGSLPGTVVAVY